MHASDESLIVPRFEIERVFNAPLDRVWKAWSERDQFAQWWGPAGCSVDVPLLDFREGGFLHYAMRSPAAPAMWGRFNYRQITPMARIVWLNSFANEQCGIARAPFSDLCPLEIENTVTFSGHGRTTKMTLHAIPFGASADETAYFADLCSSGSLNQGYGGTFNQLAGHLSQLRFES